MHQIIVGQNVFSHCDYWCIELIDLTTFHNNLYRFDRKRLIQILIYQFLLINKD